MARATMAALIVSLAAPLSVAQARAAPPAVRPCPDTSMFKTETGAYECKFVTTTATVRYRLSEHDLLDLPTWALAHAAPGIFGVEGLIAQNAYGNEDHRRYAVEFGLPSGKYPDYVFCNYVVHPTNVNPNGGKYRPMYEITDEEPRYAVLEVDMVRRPPFEGRTWFDVYLAWTGVHKDYLSQARNQGICRPLSTNKGWISYKR